MKKIIINLLFLILFSSILPMLDCQTTCKPYFNDVNIKMNDFDDVFGNIEVIKPSDSEVILIGDNYLIKWTSKGGIDLVTIGLFKNFEFLENIVLITINDGSFEWEVAFYDEASDYSIGIWDYNDFNCDDFSDFFTITLIQPFNFNPLSLIGLIISFCALSFLIYYFFLIILRNNKAEVCYFH